MIDDSKNMKPVGFVGKKRSGKSLSACILAEWGYVHVNFKDALLAEAKRNFPDLLKYWSDQTHLSVEDLLEKKTVPEIRLFLQNYGTELRRREDPLYWALKWMRMALKQTKYPVVADDVRFLNEAEMVRELGGVIIRINRPGTDNGDKHPSEQEMEEIAVDYTIENDGTPGDLAEKLKGLNLFK